MARPSKGTTVTATLTRRSGRAPAPDAPARTVERRVGLPSGRAVVGGLLVALAAVGTFLAYADATADDRIDVLVARRDLTPGEVVGADDVRLVPVDVSGGVRGLFGAVEAAVGRQVASPVAEGEFLLASATRVAPEGEEVLELSLAVPASRAAGRLQPGDRVDVFSTWSGEVTELVAVDARVLEVEGASSSGLGGGGDTIVVRLAVADFDQVEALVHAQAAGDVTMVRAALGSEVEELGREYRPRTGTGGDDADPDGD